MRRHRRAPASSARAGLSTWSRLAWLGAALALWACSDKAIAPGALDRIIIDRSVDSTLAVGQSVTLRAVAVDRSNTALPSLTQSIAWRSSEPTVATVDEQTGVVVGRGDGTTRITAAIGNTSESITFEVRFDVGSVTVELPAGDSVRVGDKVQVCAVVRAPDQTVLTGREVTWTVDDNTVASPSATSGACIDLTGKKLGEVTVAAESQTKQDDSTVRVIPVVASLTIGSKAENGTAGDCLALDAVAKDENGEALNRVITYHSSNESVATVDEEAGAACWEAPGQATITAESEGKSDDFAVTVRAAPLTVVGYADLESDTRRAFKWTRDGGLEELSVLASTVSAMAKGVNDNGQIVGETRSSDGIRHAFIYTAGRGMRELRAPDGASGAQARAINNSGQVGGSAFFPDGSEHMMVWVVEGAKITPFDRLTPDGWNHANAEAINGTGTIAGTARDDAGNARPYRATAAGAFVLLDPPSDAASGEATGINDRGDIVGFLDDVNGVRRPFVAANGIQMRAVDLPSGCPEAVAFGIDSEGRMVITGLSCQAPGKDDRDRGFVRSAGGNYTELFNGNTQARYINGRGDVVGWTIPQGDNRNEAFLWMLGDSDGTRLGRFGEGQRSNALAVNEGQ